MKTNPESRLQTKAHPWGVTISITAICREIEDLLLEKNRKYGDSALKPSRIFSKASTDEQLNVRIDDKLSRIASAQTDDTEDAELDLIGYLILKRVYKKLQGTKPPRLAPRKIEDE